MIDFVTAHWPVDVPSECLKLIDGDDCLERNLPPNEWCISCIVYDQLLNERPSEEEA